MKRLLLLLLALALLLALVPAVFAAESEPESEPEDLWQQITAIEDRAAARAESTETRVRAYASVVDTIVAAVEQSADYTPGSLERHGDFFFWRSADGTPNGYSPRLRARIRENGNPDVDPEAFAGVETTSYAVRGGGPAARNVAVFQPYYGLDSSFTNQYPEEGKAIAKYTGGSSTTYTTTSATIDNIAAALESCSVVIFDSHGDTDYADEDTEDYTSRANTSYLCLQTSTGITDADHTLVQGPYGSYYHAYYAGYYGSMKYYCVDGTAIANHMTGTAPHNMLWSAICLGMATDGLHAPLRAKGVEVAYGYSQSVTFDADFTWEAAFWKQMCRGAEVRTAITAMKSALSVPDPYVDVFPAYPIVVSSEDSYPGHGRVDAVQTVRSTWTLGYQSYVVTALANDASMGTVVVEENVVTAIPAAGCYVKDYTLVSGSAQVTREGDRFTLALSGDCTIRINFARKTTATVRFSLPEGASCAGLTGYVGDALALPTPTGTPRTVQPYVFVGWTEAPVNDLTQTAPAYYTAGSTYTPQRADITLYGLYALAKEEPAASGVCAYRLVTETPASWAGDYVIAYDGRVALSASGEQLNAAIASAAAAVDRQQAGFVQSGTDLLLVRPEYVYTVGGETDSWTIKMKGSDNYLAYVGGGETMTTATSGASTFTRWELALTERGVSIRSSAEAGWQLQFNPGAKIFCCFKNTQQNVSLYRAVKGRLLYQTKLPVVASCTTHTFGQWKTLLAATCTAAGQAERTCTVCGTKETKTLEPLDHDWSGTIIQKPSELSPGAVLYHCTRCAVSRIELLPVVDPANPKPLPDLPEGPAPWKSCAEGGACPGGAFVDMPAKGNWAHIPIDWAVTMQITNGTSPTTFRPGAPCTRGQVVTFLWRAAGCPKPETNAATFADVVPGAYYETAVRWAVERGITNGMTPTSFGPDATCTRGQVVTFLYRFAGAQTDAVSNFTDVAPEAFYAKPVAWAVEQGVTNGLTATTFGPNDTCTRAHVVTFLYRLVAA